MFPFLSVRVYYKRYCKSDELLFCIRVLVKLTTSKTYFLETTQQFYGTQSAHTKVLIHKGGNAIFCGFVQIYYENSLELKKSISELKKYEPQIWTPDCLEAYHLHWLHWQQNRGKIFTWIWSTKRRFVL